jgi:pyridoxal phosphate-dependent aminotransferase EpsN
MLSRRIYLSPPHTDGSEIEFVKEAFDTNWLAPYGTNIDSFEKKLEDYFCVEDIALVNSGTSAIHLALNAIGVEKDDYVLVPTLNYIGCVNPILYQGAVPVFIDSEPETWNMCPNQTEQAIEYLLKQNIKPKAILLVHLFGMPAKIQSFVELSQKYDIPIIEDAADALGSLYLERPVGTFGSIGVVSFNGNKIITASTGGAVISESSEIITLIKHISSQAQKKIPYYVYDRVGYNYTMSNVIAGIGRRQFDFLPERLKARKLINRRYRQNFESDSWITIKEDINPGKSNHWLSVIQLEEEFLDRDELHFYLNSLNIESRPVWTPIHTQKMYSSCLFFGENQAETIFKKGLCLPSGSNLLSSDQDFVCDSIKEYHNIKKNGGNVNKLRVISS